MRIQFIFAGGKFDPTIEELAVSYIEKINHFFPGEISVISSREKEQEQIRHDESEKMLAKIKSGDIVVVFDERGKKLSSEKFASQMASHIDTGTKQIIVVVGGAYGVTDAVRERANLVLAFSDMIFPHQLARIMALEQLYRAFSIRAGTKYHHD